MGKSPYQIYRAQTARILPDIERTLLYSTLFGPLLSIHHLSSPLRLFSNIYDVKKSFEVLQTTEQSHKRPVMILRFRKTELREDECS